MEKDGYISELRHARIYLEFFREKKIQRLSRSELLVYMVISFHADDLGLAKLTTKQILALSGLTYSQFRRALFGNTRNDGCNNRKGLIKNHIIRRIQRHGMAWFYEIIRPANLTRALELRKQGEI